MKKLFFAILLTLCMGTHFALAEEAGAEKTDAEKAEAEKAKAKDEKPRPDSVLSSVLALPVVQGWSAWMASKNTATSLTAWGEAVKTVDGYECWGVAVGETRNDETHTWKRFCVTPGGKIWVESLPDPKTDEISYSVYDDWVSKCKPTTNSPGTC